MASDKRDFKDFAKFPGSLIAGIYTFPPLYHDDSMDRQREWKAFVRLVNNKNIKPGIDWDINSQKTKAIINANYTTNVPIAKGWYAQFWVESGIANGKITRHEATYTLPKNEGKANERNVIQQALILGRSKWLKRKQEGGREKGESRIQKKYKDKRRYFPMLLHKYENESKHIVFPALGQPKLDGIRATINLCLSLNCSKKQIAKATINNVDIYSRTQKDLPGFDMHRKELLELLKNCWSADKGSLYLDGEFYKHGLRLQEISGAVTDEKKNTDKTKATEFHIFDAWYPNEELTSRPFVERFRFLRSKFNHVFAKSKPKWLKLIETKKIKSSDDVDSTYQQFLSLKYEGLIIRNAAGPYLYHPTRQSNALRSREVLKIKQRHSAEYEIVDFTQGTKGRDKGALLWVCKVANGKTFVATPKNTTYVKRYKLFADLEKQNNLLFKNKYLGKMMTIEYEDLSKLKVPLRAKALIVRDYE
jgi:hypothetical protein